MTKFMVSFGSMYRTEPHPTLGFWPDLAEGVLTVEAEDYHAAREAVHSLIGKEWCAVYGPDDPPGWGPPDLGPLKYAVLSEQARPSSWTVGVQLTLNADGTAELDLGDAPSLLDEEGAPPSVWGGLAETLTLNRPVLDWAPRSARP